MPTLEEVQESIYAGFDEVPYHKHLGLEIERTPPSGAKVSVAAPGKAGPAPGEHSAATVYTIGDVACSAQVCELLARRALELELGALFLTVGASIRLHGPAYGRLEATATMAKGLDESSGAPRKGTVETDARVVGEGGELVAEQRMRFYVRFMDPERIGEMAPGGSEIVRLHGQ